MKIVYSNELAIACCMHLIRSIHNYGTLIYLLIFCSVLLTPLLVDSTFTTENDSNLYLNMDLIKMCCINFFENEMIAYS